MLTPLGRRGAVLPVICRLDPRQVQAPTCAGALDGTGSSTFAASTGDSLKPNLLCSRRRTGGAHQFALPSRVIVAGTSRQRTTVASTATAIARARPISLMARF